MLWLSLETMMEGLDIPSAIYFTQLKLDEVPLITEKLRAWYPDIVVGTESRHLEPSFYRNNYAFTDGGGDQPFYGLVCRTAGSGEILGFMSLEKNDRGRQISSPMGAIEPSQRGMGIAHIGTAILEHFGRKIGAEVALYFATLKIARTQKNAERHGFQLVGIVPAFDRDAISPGVIKRVYEGLYAKVLVDGSEVHLPSWDALIDSTRELWTHLFGAHPGSRP